MLGTLFFSWLSFKFDKLQLLHINKKLKHFLPSHLMCVCNYWHITAVIMHVFKIKIILVTKCFMYLFLAQWQVVARRSMPFLPFTFALIVRTSYHNTHILYLADASANVIYTTWSFCSVWTNFPFAQTHTNTATPIAHIATAQSRCHISICMCRCSSILSMCAR